MENLDAKFNKAKLGKKELLLLNNTISLICTEENIWRLILESQPVERSAMITKMKVPQSKPRDYNSLIRNKNNLEQPKTCSELLLQKVPPYQRPMSETLW